MTNKTLLKTLFLGTTFSLLIVSIAFLVAISIAALFSDASIQEIAKQLTI